MFHFAINKVRKSVNPVKPKGRYPPPKRKCYRPVAPPAKKVYGGRKS